jgi:hypothetical protein
MSTYQTQFNTINQSQHPTINTFSYGGMQSQSDYPFTQDSTSPYVVQSKQAPFARKTYQTYQLPASNYQGDHDHDHLLQSGHLPVSNVQGGHLLPSNVQGSHLPVSNVQGITSYMTFNIYVHYIYRLTSK